MVKTGRIAKWDNVKFILILSVVLGHFLARYTDSSINAERLVFFIYTYHMPAFVFISGLFAKRTINEKRYDKIFGFLMLYLVTKYALFFVKVVRGSTLEFSYFEMNDVSWYAFAIFVFCLMTIFLRRFDWKWVLTISILNALLAGYATDIDTWLSLSRILTFYPFFLLGYYLKPEDIMEFTNRKWVKAASWCVWIVTAAVVFFKIDAISWYLNILKGKHGYDTLSHAADYGFVLRAGWYVLAIVLTMALIAVTPEIRCFVSTMGSRTMQIYALHYIPMLIFFGNFHGEAWIKSICPNHQIPVVILIGILTTCLLSIKPIEVAMNWIIYPKTNNSR